MAGHANTFSVFPRLKASRSWNSKVSGASVRQPRAHSASIASASARRSSSPGKESVRAGQASSRQSQRSLWASLLGSCLTLACVMDGMTRL